MKGSRALITLAPPRQELDLPSRELTPFEGLNDNVRTASLPERELVASAEPTARDSASAWWLLLSDQPDSTDPEQLPRLSVTDLTDLLFGAFSLVQLAAVWRWLHGPQPWFRLRRDRDVQARSRQDIRRQRQAEHRERQLAAEQRRQLDLLLRAEPLSTADRASLSKEWNNRLEQLLDCACDNGPSMVLAPGLDETLRSLNIVADRTELRRWLCERHLMDPHQPHGLRGSAWSSGFSEEQEQVAQQLLEQIEHSWPGDDARDDLTALITYTIDDISTREIDDGLALEPREEGDWIWVHIADPARLIAPGSVLDREARRRGTSLYLADGCQPMLPMALAAEGLSLRSGKRCAALSVGVLLDRDGSIRQHRITRSWVQPRYRLSYEDGDELIDLAPPGDEGLARMAGLLQQRQRWRFAQGAIGFDRAEGRFRRQNEQLELQLIDPSPSRQMVSEAMLLMGAVVAEVGRVQQLPLPYRSQARAELPPQADLNKIPEGPARDAAVQRCLSRGVQGTTPMPHFSLGLEAYVQATSPIRRYSDLLVHRQLIASLDHQPPLGQDQLAELIDELESPVRQAIQISREDQRHWQRVWFATHPGQRWAMQFLRWLKPQDRLALLHVNELAMGLVGRLESDDPEPGQSMSLEVSVPEASDLPMVIS